MAIALGLATFFSTMLGGLVALRARRARHLVLGLAAGVMLGVVAFDLIPEALQATPGELGGVPIAMLTASAGFLSLHVLERALAIHRAKEEEFAAHRHPAQSVGILAAGGLVFHSFLDGVGIGLGFQAGAAVGTAVAIAVIAHDFADGFNTFTITALYGSARATSLLLLLSDALAPVLGAVAGTLLRLPESVIGGYLGYFAGFLLYLATSDILPQAHAKHPSLPSLLCTIAGVAFMWLVVGLGR